MTERDILEMFAMLRLDESVFSFMRSNYFRGEDPLAHPLLFWSMDYTRVPAELQCDLIDLGHKNELANRSLVVMDERLDLSEIRYPVYVMAGSTDHITPWQACLPQRATVRRPRRIRPSPARITPRTHQRPARQPAFALLALTANYLLSRKLGCGAVNRPLATGANTGLPGCKAHSDLKDAPATLGNRTHVPIEDAPGRYVREK